MKHWIRPMMIAAILGFILGGAAVSAFLGTVSPPIARQFADGAGAWLHQMPDALYQLLGALGLGYIVGRSFGKDKEVEARKAEAEAISDFSEGKRQ